MLQFQGGELDIVTSVPPNQIEAIKSNPDYVLIENAVARIDYIGINVTREPFTNVAIRQAMNYAINKQSIIDNVMFGAAEVATSFLPKMPGRDASLTATPTIRKRRKDGWRCGHRRLVRHADHRRR